MQKRNQYVIENLNLARIISQKMSAKHSHVSYDDIYGYANVGLVIAASGFDENRGCSFQTYAYHCMKGAIIDGLRQEKAIFRVRGKKRVELENKKNQIETQKVQLSTPLKKIDPRHLKSEDLCSKHTLSIDAFEGVEFDDGSHDMNTVENKLDDLKKRKKILKAMKTLPANMRRLVKLHYYGNQSLKEAGQNMNLSKSWSSRMHERALSQLARCEELRALAA